MEGSDFFSLVKRHKLPLIIIPLITVVVTYFLVRNLPDTYSSQAQISTGISDHSKQILAKEVAGESQVFQEFSNMLAIIKLKKITDQVSYMLILHDLTSDAPFRKPSKVFRDVNASARRHAIEVYTKLYQTHQSLQLFDRDQNGLNTLIASMGYDAGSISSKMSAFRADNSDFINVSFDSENPKLSAFVVNSIVKEFISYYSSLVKENQRKSVVFLDSLLKRKKAVMDSATAKLRDYKIKNHILSLTEQASSLYSQLSDYQAKKQQALKDVAANTGAIAAIDSKFNPRDRKYAESALTKINGEILTTQSQLKDLTDAWIKSNYSDFYKQKIDSVRALMTTQINQSSDRNINNPLSSTTDLVSRKLTLQVDLNIAKYSIGTLNSEIARLNSSLNNLAPHEAVIQSYENEITTVTKEYEDVLAKDNQAAMQADQSVKLQQIDMAMPGAAAGSKKMLLTVVSGIVSEVLCLLVLFILFYLDDSIKQPKVLANKTGLPVLGHLNVIEGETLDLKKLWDVENRNKMQKFKDLLRSIRFEIDQELRGTKVLAITSLSPGEGKTLLAISLAYSYSIINKKVLLIDGNLDNPSISAAVHPKVFIEDFFRDDASNDTVINSGISVLGNRGTDITLLEIENEDIIREKFTKLKSKYDIIIIEVPAMDALNKAKEWLLFADKTVAVFEANQTLNEPKNEAITYLKFLGSKFSGWIFNKTIVGKNA
jgi:succinoglycan biosynthesis transport protein ExoP